MILYFLLLFIVLIIIIAAFSAKDARKKAAATANILQGMEIKYDSFIKASLNDSELDNYELKIDPVILSHKALLHLDQELNTIVHLVNSNTRSIVQINYAARFFPNLIDIIESYYLTHQKNKVNTTTSSIKIQQLKDTTLDAIQADIESRLLNINIGSN